ncbi:MAG: ATPase, partial [Pseudomonadota bacterium]
SIKSICEKLGVNRTGLISGYLNDLVQTNFVARDFTWHFKKGEPSLLSKFRLSDNYLRFYLKYIEKNLPLIEQRSFQEKSLNNLNAWTAILGLQFQNLVLHNRVHIRKLLGVSIEDMVIDNPYFQRATATHQGCQIDYIIQTKLNNLFACEIKFSSREIGIGIIEEMEQKLTNLQLPKGFSCWPVLIHVNGVSDKVEDSNYFFKIIDFGELLENQKFY